MAAALLGGLIPALVSAALLGGLIPALVSAAFGSMMLNWYFTPPVHRITIADPKNILALVVFVAVAVSVASVVDLAARRTHQAARLRAESEILSFLAGNVLRGETGLEALLERVRETFGTESVALLERESDVAPWTCAGRVGLERELERPEDADVDVPVGDHVALALNGRVLPTEDRRILAAFAAQTAVVLDRQRLQSEADQAKGTGRGQPHPHRPAGRRQPRPAHAAHRDQGIGLFPALGRRGMVRGRPGRTPRGHRGGRRPPRTPGGQPPRHVPPPEPAPSPR